MWLASPPAREGSQATSISHRGTTSQRLPHGTSRRRRHLQSRRQRCAAWPGRQPIGVGGTQFVDRERVVRARDPRLLSSPMVKAVGTATFSTSPSGDRSGTWCHRDDLSDGESNRQCDVQKGHKRGLSIRATGMAPDVSDYIAARDGSVEVARTYTLAASLPREQGARLRWPARVPAKCGRETRTASAAA